jgi:DNA-damage-inducible protein J
MTTLQIRIDPKLKKRAQKTALGLGMDLSGAIKVFLVQMVATQSLPFNVDCPIGHDHVFSPRAERKLRAAIADVESSTKSFPNARALFKDILGE